MMGEEEGDRSSCAAQWSLLTWAGDLALPPLCLDQYFLRVLNQCTLMLRSRSTVKEGERDERETNKEKLW